ncbi:MAG: aminotransferase class IV [Armatimonadetes bacterium]|nr:aminotransferase class IV [Armatimonadota bacterium]
MAGIAWVNGRLLAPEEPAISPLDGGFMYGEGLFETMRAYGGKVFRLEQHVERLLVSSAELSFTPPTADKLTQAVGEALRASDLADAMVRLTVTPGPAGSPEPTVVVLVRPLSLPPHQIYESGCLAVSVPVAHTPDSPLRRLKSLNYLDKLLAQRTAARRDAHEAILVDADGCIIEGAMRNIFAVFDGELVTPPLSRAFLPGITRATIIEIAQREGLPHRERDVPLKELYTADEAFLTSSVAEIIPIASVDGHALLEAPGRVTRRLTCAYEDLVTPETGSTCNT